MLKLFFNKESPVVYAAEAVGALLLGVFLWRGTWRAWSPLSLGALGVCCVSYLFLRFCATYRWYPRAGHAAKYLGIEMHFKKALVPTAYLLALTGGWLCAGGSPLALSLVDPLLLLIAHVNVHLLRFHRQDHDPTPVNCFSGGGTLAIFDNELCDMRQFVPDPSQVIQNVQMQ